MLFLQYLIFSGLACYAAAATVKFNQIFTVDDTCTSANRDLDSMMAETLDMVSNAMTALETLIDTSNYGLFRGNGKNMARLINAANTAWGMTVPAAVMGVNLKQPISTDLNVLKQAHATYATLQTVLQTGKGLPATAGRVFFCDSTSLIWTTQAVDIFTASVPGMTITDIYPDEHGFWKDPNHQTNKVFNFVIDEYNGVGICADEFYPLTWGGQPSNKKPAEGITYSTKGNMFLCPKTWSKYKLSLKSLKGTTGPAEWENFKSVPGVFLHEMLHLISPEGDNHITDQKTFFDNSNAKSIAYGTGMCMYLSNGFRIDEAQGQQLALLNADSYNVFATMVYLPQADWELT